MSRLPPTVALPLETPRLRIRSFRTSDAPAIFEACRQRRVSRGIPPMPYPYRLRDAEAYIQASRRSLRKRERFPLAIEERDGQALVGAIEISGVDWRHSHAELGYWITPSRWGCGYATEAGRKMCEFGFQTLRLHRLHAGVLSFNPRSARVLRRLGFRREATLVDFFFVGRRWYSVHRFVLLTDRAERRSRAP